MFVEAGGVHHKAHFHAYYEDKVGIYGTNLIGRLAGTFKAARKAGVGLGGTPPARAPGKLEGFAGRSTT